MSVTLTAQQQAAVDNRGGQLLVSAAAGSGKTRILVERLLNRVQQEHIDLDRFLVITYTKAAASELKGKVLDELNERIAAAPDDAFLRRQRVVIYRAQISTVHSFCSALLREEGYRIDLEPDFRVAEESECAILQQQVLSRLLEEQYECMNDHPDFHKLVDTLGTGRDDSRLTAIVLDMYTRVQSHPNPAQWLDEKAKAFDLRDVHDVSDTVWGKVLIQDAAHQVNYLRKRYTALLDRLHDDPVIEAAYSEAVCDDMDRLDDLSAALERGWDSAYRLLPFDFARLKSIRKPCDETLKQLVKSARDSAKKALSKLEETFCDSSETRLANMEAVRPVIECLHDLVKKFERSYTAEKRRRNILDFSDLEHLALSLLIDENGNTTELARQWSARFAEVMVDEYQDTNQVQNALFEALSSGGRTLFQVGDVKQSIYRFRLADPSIFLNKMSSFADYRKACDNEARRVVLSYNFRSRRSVLDAVNFVFENIMSESFGEVDYTEDHRLYARLPYPEHPNDRTELNVVDMSALEQTEDEAKIRKDAAEADFVARRIRQLLDSQFQVTSGDALRAVQPEDIAVLYRSPHSVMHHLTRALDRQQIPWTSDGSGEFFTSEEIMTALAFLEVIDNPHQDIPLLSVLTCPVWHFTGSDLAHLRAQCRNGDLFDCVTAGAERGETLCVDFIEELNRLRSLAVDAPGYQVLRQIYDRTGLLTVFSAMEGGSARRANLQLLYEYARSFESSGHQGVFGLTAYFRRLHENGKDLSASGREAVSGVRIMSIHKSKGLEFPVVIVAGLSRQLNRQDQMEQVLFHSELGVGPYGLDTERGIRYTTLAREAVRLKLDREMKAEELRLLYVAMTRAREKLILVYSSNDWAKTAERLTPNAGEKPAPEALNGLGCTGDWLLLPVLARYDAGTLRANFGVMIPTLIADDHWDINWVPAQKPAVGQITQQKEEQQTHPLSEEEIRRLTWHNPNAALELVPSKVTATQLKGRALDSEASENTVITRKEIEFNRPRFEQSERGLTATQAGTAVHLVMQLIRPDHTGSADEVAEEIARLTAMECLTPEMAAVVKPGHIAAFFASEYGRQALQAADLRREFKFSVLESAAHFDAALPQEEQVLLQGVVDCCYSIDGAMTVIDFKTDRVRRGEERVHSERYRTQLDVYTSALSRITGMPVAHRVLWYLSNDTAVEL